MPTKGNENNPRSKTTRRHVRACHSCGDAIPAGALIAGECPDCAGLVALPLRGHCGRFMSFGPTVERMRRVRGAR